MEWIFHRLLSRCRWRCHLRPFRLGNYNLFYIHQLLGRWGRRYLFKQRDNHNLFDIHRLLGILWRRHRYRPGNHDLLDIYRVSAIEGGAIFNDGGTMHFCRIYNDTGIAVYNNGVYSFDASDNWWGSNSDPSRYTSGNVISSPWLVLGVMASPSTINPTQTSTISANLTDNSARNTLFGTYVPDNIPVSFSSTGGTVNPSKGSTQNGVSKTTFTPSSTGTASVTASVDGQSMTAPVTVISGGLPEFPSPVIPAILIIGLLGTVLFIR